MLGLQGIRLSRSENWEDQLCHMSAKNVLLTSEVKRPDMERIPTGLFLCRLGGEPVKQAGEFLHAEVPREARYLI